MRLLAIVVALAALSGPVKATSDRVADAKMNSFLRTWEDNATVTQEKVDELYARRVTYYGRVMSREQVLEAKRYLVGRYPSRKYRVVPGTVAQHCGGGVCTIDLVMNWTVFGGHTTARGSTTVSLTLVSEGGTYKIAAESGVAVPRFR